RNARLLDHVVQRPRGDQMVRRSGVEKEQRDLAGVQYERRAIGFAALTEVHFPRILERRARPRKLLGRPGDTGRLTGRIGHLAEPTPSSENAGKSAAQN